MNDLNQVKTEIRVKYPETAPDSVKTYYSNISIDVFANKYNEARLKDEVLSIPIGIGKYGEPSSFSAISDHFETMLIPARYIQSIRGYDYEG